MCYSVPMTTRKTLKGQAATDWLNDKVARAKDRIEMCERFGLPVDPADAELVAKEESK